MKETLIYTLNSSEYIPNLWWIKKDGNIGTTLKRLTGVDLDFI